MSNQNLLFVLLDVQALGDVTTGHMRSGVSYSPKAPRSTGTYRDKVTDRIKANPFKGVMLRQGDISWKVMGSNPCASKTIFILTSFFSSLSVEFVHYTSDSS